MTDVANAIETRLADLPDDPGCYIFRDAAGVDIYVGKAKNLRKRVRSYFQSGRGHPARTLRLVQEVADIDWLVTASEVEALLLENRLIKDLQPRFNVKLKDDKSYPLLAITREAFAKVFITRDRDLTGVDYYGPFGSAAQLRQAYNYLMRVFQFRVCDLEISEDDPRRRHFRPCLNYHIKRCSAPCTTRIDAAAYGADIKALKTFLGGRARQQVLDDLQARMASAAAEMRYEDAARCRDQLRALQRLGDRGKPRDWDVGAAPTIDGETALQALRRALDLAAVPRHIEGFDIAHLHGEDVTASQVQFIDGLPNKQGYRHFRVRTGEDGNGVNDDFAAMAEVVGRRYRRLVADGDPLPDLILIDGGLGQVHAAASAVQELSLTTSVVVGLAKRDEVLIAPDGHEWRLGRRNPGLKLLMYVRDEAHRFCRRYHHVLRGKRQRG